MAKTVDHISGLDPHWRRRLAAVGVADAVVWWSVFVAGDGSSPIVGGVVVLLGASPLFLAGVAIVDHTVRNDIVKGRLEAAGQPTDGVVTSVSVETSDSGHHPTGFLMVRYEYEASGETRHGEFRVRTKSEPMQVGDRVPLVYLRDRPDISGSVRT